MRFALERWVIIMVEVAKFRSLKEHLQKIKAPLLNDRAPPSTIEQQNPNSVKALLKLC